MNFSSYIDEITSRHQGIFTSEEQAILSNAVICGAGAGGVGGWAYLALARLGCFNFKIADPEVFDTSNINRQAGSSIDSIGKNKAEIIAQQIKQINPKAQVTVYDNGLTYNNISSFVENGNIIIDGVDLYKMEIKKALFDAARAKNIPVLSCPILGFGAALGFFHPTKSPSFEQYFGSIPANTDTKAYNKYIQHLGINYFGFKPKLNWSLFTKRVEEDKVPSLGLSCMLSGSMTVTGVVDYLLEKNQFPVVPTTIHIDLLQQKIVKIGFLKRLFLKLYIDIYLHFIKK